MNQKLSDVFSKIWQIAMYKVKDLLDLNFFKFHTTVSKNLIVNKKKLPLITFGNAIQAFTKPFYMNLLFRNKSCAKLLVKLCELPLVLLENVPKTNSKFLFLLTDPLTVLLILIQ
jgi:hypothetical protein